MQMSIWTVSGALAVLALITAVGVRAGSKIKTARDFTTGSGMGVGMVAGSLIGTLVGGASTIGTAQLAFTYGLSAWWFTLGGGIGLAVMAFWFVGPLRRSGLATLPQLLTPEYGKHVATAAALLMSIGTFISIVSQLLSGAALITLGNGADNLGVYAALFARSAPWEMALSALIFLLMALLWTHLASRLASLPALRRFIERRSRILVPAVFILLGIWILFL